MHKLLSLILFVFSLECFSQHLTKPILGAWEFNKVGEQKKYMASVPGTIHGDLLINGLIPDPYYNTNEQQIQWIENEDWEYTNGFSNNIDPNYYNHIELVFGGLDTYAKVYLNGQLILSSNNSFLEYRVDIKPYLKKGGNQLKVIFESAVKKGKELAKQLTYTLPGDEKVFTRKPQYQYGWDWGPRLVTCGITKPVEIHYWNDIDIISIQHQTQSISASEAQVNIITEIKSDTSLSTKAILKLKGTNFDSLDTQYFSANIKKGTHTYTFTCAISSPKLWNCSGLGDANLYYYTLNVLVPGKAQSAYKSSYFGLRTIELIKQNDKDGQSFYFKVNGKPVFIKGANYIPESNFSPNLELSSRQIVEMAKKANMNMLRIWGGGVYANDILLWECSKSGILIWQDFMFACAMYPGDSSFINNVTEEAEYQVQRLRNHPCLALWCGNNEADEGWHNWGWQKQYNYSKTDSAKIWSDYQNLFHTILPDVVKKFDDKTPYVSSSPMIGWGKKESLLRGDSHYWGVWWGMEPFEIYEKKVGRFMSEYGFQGMPSYFTLKHYGDSLDLNSTYIKAHQKHPTGYQTINTYMERDYTVPKDFFKYVYTSQLLQRDGMQIAIEAHRRNKPYCMGTLYWQWNDCWPVTSWSAIDYDYRPKALYYATKKLYSNFCISVAKSKGQYQIYVISDSLKNINASLETKLKDTKGKTLLTKTKSIIIKENSSEILEKFSEEELKPFHKNELYLSCNLIVNDKTITHKNYFFVKPKELKLHKPNINITHTNSVIKITSDVFVKDLYLFNNVEDLHLSDNYFDIEPNETIEIDTKIGVELLKQIQHISLYDINH